MRRLPQYLLSAHCLTIGRHSLSLWEESIAIHCSSLRLCEETPPHWGDCSWADCLLLPWILAYIVLSHLWIIHRSTGIFCPLLIPFNLEGTGIVEAVMSEVSQVALC